MTPEEIANASQLLSQAVTQETVWFHVSRLEAYLWRALREIERLEAVVARCDVEIDEYIERVVDQAETIEALQALVPQWRDAKADPPSPDEFVIVHWWMSDVKGTRIVGEGYYSPEGHWTDEHLHIRINPTHWMPLPDPPVHDS